MQSNFSELTNTSSFDVGTIEGDLTLHGQFHYHQTTPNALLYADSSGTIMSTNVLNTNQIVVGSTGSKPMVLTLTPGDNIAIDVLAGIIKIGMIANPVISGLTLPGATGIASFSSLGVLQDSTISNLNGCAFSKSGSVITASMSQDLQMNASPTFTALGLSGATVSKLASFNGSRRFQSTTLVSGNGITSSLIGSTLTLSTPQDVQTTASPAFVGM